MVRPGKAGQRGVTMRFYKFDDEREKPQPGAARESGIKARHADRSSGSRANT